jgi:A/G-specific adenine glycosylase
MFTNLISWSKDNYVTLPWRERRSLYTTLVSEIMLQQTTVSTVVNHFDRFMEIYPTVEDLAASTEDEVCMAWKGLGYYRRARNLRKAAIDICEKFGGDIPLDYDKLVSINGVGDYTANAILSIGADKKALAIDANIERVVSRILGLQSKKGPKLHKLIKERFAAGDLDLKKKESYRDLNEAFMDLGRNFCQARKVSCELCPIRKSCQAFASGEPLSYPEVPVVKTAKFYELDLLRVYIKNRNRVKGFIKSEKEWLSGQVELPTFVINSEDTSLKQYPKLTKKVELKGLKKFKTSITKYKINNYILTLTDSEFEKFSKSQKYQFFNSDETKTNFATSALKIFKKLDG